jgi:hypothetical protein
LYLHDADYVCVAGHMPIPRLEEFSEGKPLRVFCPDPVSIIASFENYLPPSQSVGRISSGTRPEVPAKFSWIKPNWDYYAYLPKHRSFRGHLLAPLKHHTPRLEQRDGRWYVDDKTRDVWWTLDVNLSVSINLLINGGVLLELDRYAPPLAVKYGFTRGHKTLEGLRVSLEMSRHAFVHRLAYLTYIISRRYQWDTDLPNQGWWKELSAMLRPSWVDGVWEAVYSQWKSRNFVGVAVHPAVGKTLRWLRPALWFGVPIWVYFPRLDAYSSLSEGWIVKLWIPTEKQVIESQEIERAKRGEESNGSLPLPKTPRPDPLPSETPNNPPPTQSESSPPLGDLRQGACRYESWEEFFKNRDKADQERLKTASAEDKNIWESRAHSAKKFSFPGKGGPTVFIWESCDSGGFVRIPQTRHEAARDWEYYYQEALIFHPRKNTWDYCPFVRGPAVEGGAPDDLYDDGHTEHWYTEPDSPASPPKDSPAPPDFLYPRYGFLSVEPAAHPQSILPFTDTVAFNVVGLGLDSSGRLPEHLRSFISSILQSQLPSGHCDLSPACLPDDQFPPSGRNFIRDKVFRSEFPELSPELTFTFVNTPNDRLFLVVHDSLSVLQMGRTGVEPTLTAELGFLLHNGCRFTLLYKETLPLVPPDFNILTFPIRDPGWEPTQDDFRAYMSRLSTFFLERPYVAAAAFCRGGIAWRLALEVLGAEGSVDMLLKTYPDESSHTDRPQGTCWFHEPDEFEWFYLVGGYETWTGLCFLSDVLHHAHPQAGKGNQTQDMSWWPKVTTFEASSLNAGCWTPLCERWFRKRLEALRSGSISTYSSSAWQKNLRYGKNHAKEFIRRSKNLGQDYLSNICNVQKL